MALTRPLVALAALALLSACGTETEPTPAAAPSPSPRAVVTTVPADFSLGPGADWQNAPEPFPLYVCGTDRYVPGEDRRGATLYTAQLNVARDLTLHADDTTAGGALAALDEAIAACPEQDRGEGEFQAARLLASDLGEGSVAYLDQYGDGDGPNGEGTVILVVRVGNAVLTTTSHQRSGMADLDLAQAAANRLGEEAAPVMDAMCAFAAEGCDHVIPDGLALDTGLVADRVVGPARSLPGVDLAALCDVGDWPFAPEDRLVVSAMAPEYAETRELLAYPDAGAAANALAAARAAVEACTPPAGLVLDVLDGEPGGPGGAASYTFAQTYDEGLGGTVYQLVLAGRALLVVASSGELSRETVQQSADAFTADNRAVVDLVCEWTEAGC